MNKSLVFVFFLLIFSYSANLICFLSKPGWKNPLKFGYKTSFKKDFPSFTQFKQMLKASHTREMTRGNITIIEKSTFVDKKTFDQAVDKSLNVKIGWWFSGQIYYFFRQASWHFKKSHFEG